MWDGRPRSYDDPYWAQTGRAWIEYAPGKRRLVDLTKPAPVNHARSSFPAPAIMRDAIEPILAMDGKMTDSLSHYRRTLRADGNPRGETYTEIGNESLPDFKASEFDEAQRRDDIYRAIADIKNGNIPPVAVLED